MALKRIPGGLYAQAYNNMGNALKDKGEAAIESYKQALKIKPDYAQAYSNMGIALKGKGDLKLLLAATNKHSRLNRTMLRPITIWVVL